MRGYLEPAVQLVITPPGVFGAAFAERFQFRMTLGVLTQLLVEATSRVIITSPFFQPGFGLSRGSIAEATEAALIRGVNVDIMSTRRSLDTLSTTLMSWRARGTLRLFCPAANLEDDEKLGSHAKFCVVDGERAYIGSANLTGPGLSEHLEVGVLVNGDLAKQIEQMWLYSIQIGLFSLAT
jgi:phosphatidylserine/phosphatidylglycerophosphate/cardiolipin synthase-like enzyme